MNRTGPENEQYQRQREELLGVHRARPTRLGPPGPSPTELPPPLIPVHLPRRQDRSLASSSAPNFSAASSGSSDSSQSSTNDLDDPTAGPGSKSLLRGSYEEDSGLDSAPPPIPVSRSVYHYSSGPATPVRSALDSLVSRPSTPASSSALSKSQTISPPPPESPKSKKASRRVVSIFSRKKDKQRLLSTIGAAPKSASSSHTPLKASSADSRKSTTDEITSAILSSLANRPTASPTPSLNQSTNKMDANYNTNLSASQHGMSASELVPDDPTFNVQASYSEVIEGLKTIYKEKILPVEERYKFDEFHSPLLRSCDFEAKPMVLLLGQYSVGKTSFIEYLLERPFPGQRIGPEPTTDKFIAVSYGDTDRTIPGAAVSVDNNKPFSGLNKFGTGFLSKFEAAECKSSILEKIMFVDTPGVLSGEKQRLGRTYDFISVIEWFAERADMILLLFDAHKLDISDEFKLAIGALRGHDDKVRVVLNKADSVSTQQLMRVYGALMWSLGKVVASPEVMKVYIGSFWNQPLRFKECAKLFEVEQQDLIRDLRALPRNSAVRKVNELVKRARLVKVHAYVISHLKDQMPMLFGKDSKKEELIKNLYNEFCTIERKWRLPPGDFPIIEKFQQALKLQDFDKFAKFSDRIVPKLDEVLGLDLPKLMLKISPPKTEEEKNPFANPPPNDWVITPEKATFDEIFYKLNPENGKLSGGQAKQVLMETGVKTDLLRKIWTLSDIDKDGSLDADEFAVAMYLTVEVRKQNLENLPDKLPKDWIPPSKRVLFM